jgi:hypothetical protein
MDLGGGHFVTPAENDDPLMRLATKKALQELPKLHELFKVHRRDTMVKFPFETDAGHAYDNTARIAHGKVRDEPAAPC